jgi:spore germination protein YaaH
LNKKFSFNAHIELDCKVLPTDTNAKYGIRIMPEDGNTGKGYAARMNFQTNQVEFIDFEDSSHNRYTDMSVTLAGTEGERYTMKFQYLEGQISIWVGDRKYLDFPFTLPAERAYGIYGTSCTVKAYRLNISTLDRFEPMEKIIVEVDGVKYPYGEVERTVPYDDYGYLVYTGYPGNVSDALRSIPSDPDQIEDASSQGDRAGTIFETEVIPYRWNLDYRNLPITKVPSWIGNKQVKIYMEDPGVWLRSFYIGDSEGYSVSYNSDKTGFIRTSQMVLDYGCKGIAMWTLGQEDPKVFEYISSVQE